MLQKCEENPTKQAAAQGDRQPYPTLRSAQSACARGAHPYSLLVSHSLQVPDRQQTLLQVRKRPWIIRISFPQPAVQPPTPGADLAFTDVTARKPPVTQVTLNHQLKPGSRDQQ